MMSQQNSRSGGVDRLSWAALAINDSPLIGVARAASKASVTPAPITPAAIPLAWPTWHFSVLAEMPQSLVTKYGGGLGALAKVQAQLATISSRFNVPDLFSGTFSFDLTGFGITTHPGNEEVRKPHPGHDFAVVYDETHLQGGWFGSPQAVLHAWPSDQGGVFSDNATDGLVHEFGHARGAIDVYQENVDPAKNPINHAAFDAPVGIMTYPYEETRWDQYSADVINASGSTIYQGAPIIDAALPPIFTIRAIVLGQPLAGVHIDVFPVIWNSGDRVNWLGNTVDSNPTLSGITTASGTWTLPHNPFALGSHGKPWNIAHPNFLIRARATTGLFAARPVTGYAWLPLTIAGAAAFAAPYQPYQLEVALR